LDRAGDHVWNPPLKNSYASDASKEQVDRTFEKDRSVMYILLLNAMAENKRGVSCVVGAGGCPKDAWDTLNLVFNPQDAESRVSYVSEYNDCKPRSRESPLDFITRLDAARAKVHDGLRGADGVVDNTKKQFVSDEEMVSKFVAIYEKFPETLVEAKMIKMAHAAKSLSVMELLGLVRRWEVTTLKSDENIALWTGKDGGKGGKGVNKDVLELIKSDLHIHLSVYNVLITG